MIAIKILCSTAAVVGLQWSVSNISSTSYQITRNGVTVGKTNLTTFTDQGVSPDKTYSYKISALNSGHIVKSVQKTVHTPKASPNGDAPYCPSQVIKAMSWQWSTAVNQQNGSDIWPVTWGSDGNVYLGFGDGGGFFGSDSLGRASFGIATLPANPSPLTLANAKNIYGGFKTSHPSKISGKTGSILAIGSDFYAIGSAYRSTDSGGPWSCPNHNEIIYSKGNAYSWQDSSWEFCAADKNAKPTKGNYCASSFVNFGPGYSGARDDFVYLVLNLNEKCRWDDCAQGPAKTYMARVPKNEILNSSAYECITGFDLAENPKWSSDCTKMQPIFIDNGPGKMSISTVVYNSALKRYIASAQGGYIGEAAFYEAANPWGPWSVIGYYNESPDGSGGWGNLGRSFESGHGVTLGIHFMNAWTSHDGKSMWVTFSSSGKASPNTFVAPLANQSMDSISLVNFKLDTFH